MIIKNILASVTLLLVAFASRGQNIDSLNELIQDKEGRERVDPKGTLNANDGSLGTGSREVSDPTGRLYLEKIENIAIHIERQIE